MADLPTRRKRTAHYPFAEDCVGSEGGGLHEKSLFAGLAGCIVEKNLESGCIDTVFCDIEGGQLAGRMTTAYTVYEAICDDRDWHSRLTDATSTNKDMGQEDALHQRLSGHNIEPRFLRL